MYLHVGVESYRTVDHRIEIGLSAEYIGEVVGDFFEGGVLLIAVLLSSTHVIS